ncbi:hypothetical protein EJ06DRAFT_196504 [Trichodelitschia bisporula]|uniref:Uncharacterized protein n=1 Tax=Trichodelitschia bisporula TaxID=703511 RepID=A0A6G1I806_9PEZI|nr:hypothetical protein EJ06DRAFT_196504 [Trichodelitschia bisporula]
MDRRHSAIDNAVPFDSVTWNTGPGPVFTEEETDSDYSDESGGSTSRVVSPRAEDTTYDIAFFLRNTGPPSAPEVQRRPKSSRAFWRSRKTADRPQNPAVPIPPNAVQKVSKAGTKYFQIITPTLPEHPPTAPNRQNHLSLSPPPAPASTERQNHVSLSFPHSSVGSEQLDVWIAGMEPAPGLAGPRDAEQATRVDEPIPTDDQTRIDSVIQDAPTSPPDPQTMANKPLPQTPPRAVPRRVSSQRTSPVRYSLTPDPGPRRVSNLPREAVREECAESTSASPRAISENTESKAETPIDIRALEQFPAPPSHLSARVSSALSFTQPSLNPKPSLYRLTPPRSPLEARIMVLERENRLLEAALMAVLKTNGALNACPCGGGGVASNEEAKGALEAYFGSRVA